MRAAYPRAIASIAAAIVILLLTDIAMAARVWRLHSETAHLREQMSDAERARIDLAITSERNRATTVAELVRRQAAADRELHLTLDVDSARMLLQRDGITLRSMPVTIGVAGGSSDSARVGLASGARTIGTVLDGGALWDVPERVYLDRDLPVPQDRRVKGALGKVAFVLDGGTVIYALPKDGPLSDSSYVLEGAVLVRGDDLRAIAPNIMPGMTVYVFD